MSFMVVVFTLSILISLISTSITHPIAFVAAITSQATLICFMIHMMLKTSWYAYITFLIFIGGVMVMFIYISSLASNENFFIDFKTSISMLFMTTLYFMIVHWTNNTTNESMKLNINPLVMKMYSYQLFSLLTLSMIYLLLTLLIIVELVKHFKGPLRSFI